MALITVPERNLRQRSNTLHEMFIPLREGDSRVAVRYARSGPGGAIRLVATDEKTGGSIRTEESFRTSIQGLRCRYYESWRASAGDTFTLERAYFTLLAILPAAHKYDELLCIHTDPADTDDLKQGPHLHISCAPDPMRHCHFPLAFGFLEVVLRDCDTLTRAMQRAIRVVARDVLPRYNNR